MTKEWTVTLKIIETSEPLARGCEFYGEREFKSRLAREIEQNLPSVKVAAVTVLEAPEYV